MAESDRRPRQILVADLLGGLRELADGRRVATDGDIDQRQCDAKFRLDSFRPGGTAYRNAGTPA
jgi:hypothetical protein